MGVDAESKEHVLTCSSSIWDCIWKEGGANLVAGHGMGMERAAGLGPVEL